MVNDSRGYACAVLQNTNPTFIYIKGTNKSFNYIKGTNKSFNPCTTIY